MYGTHCPGLCGGHGQESAGELPDRVVIGASGSIIKNVKSVIVPNTDHLKGIRQRQQPVSCGDPDKELEVIAQVTPEQIGQMKEFIDNTQIESGACG